MKFALLLLIVAVVVVQDVDAARRRRFSRWVRRAIRVVRKILDIFDKKRDVNEFDLDKDGYVTEEELGTVIGERGARDLMEEIGATSDRLTIDEFKRSINDLTMIAEDANN